MALSDIILDAVDEIKESGPKYDTWEDWKEEIGPLLAKLEELGYEIGRPPTKAELQAWLASREKTKAHRVATEFSLQTAFDIYTIEAAKELLKKLEYAHLGTLQ